MKKTLLFIVLLITAFALISCGDNNKEGDERDEGFLTSIENVRSGIIGTWKSTEGGLYYYNYTLDGSKCDGFSPNGNWESCTTYEVLKSGSNYILRLYAINGPANSYKELIIKILTKKEIVLMSMEGSESIRNLRI